MPEVRDCGRVIDIDVRGFVDIYVCNIGVDDVSDIDVDMNMWILMCVILM